MSKDMDEKTMKFLKELMSDDDDRKDGAVKVSEGIEGLKVKKGGKMIPIEVAEKIVEISQKGDRKIFKVVIAALRDQAKNSTELADMLETFIEKVHFDFKIGVMEDKDED